MVEARTRQFEAFNLGRESSTPRVVFRTCPVRRAGQKYIHAAKLSDHRIGVLQCPPAVRNDPRHLFGLRRYVYRWVGAPLGQGRGTPGTYESLKFDCFDLPHAALFDGLGVWRPPTSRASAAEVCRYLPATRAHLGGRLQGNVRYSCGVPVAARATTYVPVGLRSLCATVDKRFNQVYYGPRYPVNTDSSPCSHNDRQSAVHGRQHQGMMGTALPLG